MPGEDNVEIYEGEPEDVARAIDGQQDDMEEVNNGEDD